MADLTECRKPARTKGRPPPLRVRADTIDVLAAEEDSSRAKMIEIILRQYVQGRAKRPRAA